MEIGSLITRAVLTVEEGDTLQDAAQWMIERGVGSAVVVGANGAPAGIVTDRDTLKAVAQGRDGGEILVKECLTRKFQTATESTDLMDAAQTMREKNFRHLVVLDDHGALVGVFSMRDLVVGLLQAISARA